MVRSESVQLLEIEPSDPRSSDARVWCDQVLGPELSKAQGVRRMSTYAAFNSSRLAVVADAGLAESSPLPVGGEVPRGIKIRGLAGFLIYEIVQPGVDLDQDHPILFTAAFTVPREWVDEFNDWYDQEHMPMIYGSRHWSVSRRYALTETHGASSTHLALHYLSDARGFDASELKASRITPWRKKFLQQRWFVESEKMVYYRVS
jgi:hypothetical protein